MKHVFAFGIALCAVCLLGSCKSKESAYRQAYEKAKLQQNASNNEATTVTVAPSANEQQAVSVTPVNPTPAPEDNSDVRTIAGGVTVVAGEPLRTYSVVVGSFITQANAEGLMSQLKAKGYAARVVKTNETINNHTGWFRVVASSYDDKVSAVNSRNELKNTYAGAWLLYNK